MRHMRARAGGARHIRLGEGMMRVHTRGVLGAGKRWLEA